MNDPHSSPAPSPEKSPTPRTRPARWFRATSASSIGIEIAIAVCAPTLLGRWADQEWPAFAPWGIILGLVIGCGGAARSVQRTLADYRRELQDPSPADESLLMPGTMASILHQSTKKDSAASEMNKAKPNND